MSGARTMVQSNIEVKGDSYPVWLWPNVVSLDAPFVATCWQLSLAHSAGIRVPAPVTIALAVAVWSIYVIDRVFDGPGEQSPPHTFSALHRKPLVWSVVIATGLTALIAIPALPRHVLAGGLWIAGACGWYLIESQGVLRGKASKKVAMALLFSAGVVLPLPVAARVPPFLATAFVVWVNTRLIETWDRNEGPSPSLRWLLLVSGLVMVCLGGAYFEALAFGCWLLLALDIGARQMDAPVRRTLADAVLVAAVLVVR